MICSELEPIVVTITTTSFHYLVVKGKIVTVTTSSSDRHYINH